ncbi:MAG: hypothetical protein KKF44_11355 [Nanoarchaeota archaeon]|nr:hypothetical protein [Nanoarchaeota archaeon]
MQNIFQEINASDNRSYKPSLAYFYDPKQKSITDKMTPIIRKMHLRHTHFPINNIASTEGQEYIMQKIVPI